MPSTPGAWLNRTVAGLGAVSIVVWLIWSLAPFYAPHPSQGDPETVFRSHLDKRVPQALEHFDVPGVVFATVIEGRPAQIYAYGFADRRQHRPMRTDTVFAVASVSKSLTAWAVMKLAQAGQVELDASAAMYVPDWPLRTEGFAGEKVTLRRLLSHYAGIDGGFAGVRMPNEPPLSTREILAGSGHGEGPPEGPVRLVLPPGKAFLYSNPGYSLIQLVLETRSGRHYPEFMRTEILDPLGMTSSGYELSPDMIARVATPYRRDGLAIPLGLPLESAAAGLWSTAPDLARFVAAGLRQKGDGDLLSMASMTELYAPVIALPATDLDLRLGSDQAALGHFVEGLPDEGVVVMGVGADPGWMSQFYMILTTGDGLVVLTNSDRGRAVIAGIVADWATWRGHPPLKMNRSYMVLATAFQLIVAALAITALCWAVQVPSQLRAPSGPWTLRRVVLALVQAALALFVTGVWFGLIRAIAQFALPMLETPATAVICAFGMLLLARAILKCTETREKGV